MSQFTRNLVAATLAAVAASTALAQSSITPLATFGTNGWLAPGSSPYLGVTHMERGLAYNPVTGNLVLVSRSGGTFVRLLDGNTGTDLGGFDTTGMTGGTYVVNMAGVDDSGAIYVGNLSTLATSPFKVYKWDSEQLGLLIPPAVVYDALTGVTRTGDSFAIYGGLTTPAVFASAGSNNVSASNFVVGTLDGTNTSTAYLSVPGTSTANNDYRLGMTFVDGNTVIGNQGTNGRVTTFSGSTATLDATIPLGANQRPLDYAVIGGVPVLAVLDTNYLNNASIVSVYDLTNPAAPVLLASGTATSGTLINNVNATGSVQWGAITGNSARLYAMSTNHGIQAFTVVVDLPAAALPYGSGCGTPALALSAVGAPILPSTYQLQVDNLQPSVIAGFFIFGLVPIPAGAPIPIAPGCMQYVLPITTLFFFPAGAPSFQQPQNLPNDPTYKGLSIYVQAGSFDVSSAILASNGLRLRLNTF